MNIKVRKEGDVNILSFSSSMRTGEGDVLRFRETFTELLAAGERKFVFDMASVPWMDTAGIAEIVACQRRAKDRGGVIRLVLSSKVSTIMTLTQLTRVFTICENVDAALDLFDK